MEISSARNFSASKLMRPSSSTKHGIPIDPQALTGSNAGDESRRRMNSFRFLTCEQMSMISKSGLPESLALTSEQSGQVAVTYTFVMVLYFVKTGVVV